MISRCVCSSGDRLCTQPTQPNTDAKKMPETAATATAAHCLSQTPAKSRLDQTQVWLEPIWFFVDTLQQSSTPLDRRVLSGSRKCCPDHLRRDNPCGVLHCRAWPGHGSTVCPLRLVVPGPACVLLQSQQGKSSNAGGALSALSCQKNPSLFLLGHSAATSCCLQYVLLILHAYVLAVQAAVLAQGLSARLDSMADKRLCRL